MEARTILLALARKYGNDWEKIFEALKTKETIEDNKYFFDIDNEKALTILDEDYPDFLKNTFKPPFVIYYDGNIKSIKRDNLTYLVGKNTIGINENYVVVNDKSWGKVAVGNDLVIWTNGSYYENAKLCCGIAKNLAITKKIDKNEISIALAMSNNIDIYITPTFNKSYNNDLIKQGANLLDCVEDLY